MLNIYFLLPVITLCVIGVYFSVKEIASLILKNSIGTSVVVEIGKNVNEAEQRVRHALFTNPYSDIIVIDKSDSAEVGVILRHLASDYERVRIEKSPDC